MKRLITKIDDRLYNVGPFGFVIIVIAIVSLIITIANVLTPFFNYLIWGMEY